MNIPPGQNAFTYKPTAVFSKADKREFRYTEQGKAGGAKRAMQQKGMAVPELSKFRKK